MSAHGVLDHGKGSKDALLADGRVVTVRPVRADDREGLLRLHAELSNESRRRRFFSVGANDGAAYVEHLCSGSGDLVACLVALLDDDLVGVVSAERVGPHSAEFAAVVAERCQNKGVGTVLLDHLAALCRDRGVTHLIADVLMENGTALEMLRDAGADVASTGPAREVGVVHLDMPTAAGTYAMQLTDDRESAAQRLSLAALFSPRSVALVGVRRDGTGIGAAVLDAIRAGGFTGSLHVLHPHAVIDGVSTARAWGEIGAPVDLVVVATPPETVESVLAEAAEAGVRGAVVLTAGVSAIEGAPARLLALARSHSMRLVGPNCLGVLDNDPGIRLDATFGVGLPPAGGLAIASQSGGVGIVMLDQATKAAVGVRTFVSLGDKLDVSGNDLLAAWYDDPAVTMAALYLESLGNPRRFLHLAHRFSLRKPLLAVAAGRSSAGRRAGAVHTGAVGLDEATAAALFAQSGVIVCSDAEGVCLTAAVLAQQPLPRGGRVAIVTNTAGVGVLAADAASAAGLEVPLLSEELQRRIGEIASAAVAQNPVDVGVAAPAEAVRSLVDLLAESAEVDAVLVVMVHTGVRQGAATTTPTTTPPGPGDVVPAAWRVPVVSVTLGGEARPLAGATSLPTVGGAAQTLARVAGYARWRRVVGALRGPGVDLDVPRMLAGRRLAVELLEDVRPVPAAERELLSLYGLAPTGSKGSDAAVELAVRLQRHAEVGAMLMVRYAGAGAELLDDQVGVVLPAAPGDLAMALRRLSVWPVLSGDSGDADDGFDVEALQHVVEMLALLAAEVPHVDSVVLEPVRVMAQGAVVGSARVRVRSGGVADDGTLVALG